MNKDITMLSILSNFGCHFSCPYCVYRENKLSIPKTTIDTFGWGELENELKIYKNDIISISGGGDPLYDYENNTKFYDKLFNLLEKYNIKLELHTSIINMTFPYEKCYRVVFHFVMPTQISSINLLKGNINFGKTIVRIVYVVQKHFTKETIRFISKECKKYNIDELSFRQMIGSNGETLYYLDKYLEKGHKKDWYYIKQSDYNRYFVNDHVEKAYLQIKKHI